jgi:hypothetical protein
MTRVECEREAEVYEAVSLGQWPDRVDADLRAHVAGCAVCADIAEVASAFQDERHLALAHAPVPSSGLVWWRAELRARQEAARLAARPITVVQIASLVCVVGAAVVAVAAWPNLLPRVWSGIRTLMPGLDASSLGGVSDFASAGFGLMPYALPILIGASLLLAPLALYLAFAKEP